jgi:hypothetical protein
VISGPIKEPADQANVWIEYLQFSIGTPALPIQDCFPRSILTAVSLMNAWRLRYARISGETVKAKCQVDYVHGWPRRLPHRPCQKTSSI